MTSVQNKSLNLYLIRHGQTAWSLSGQHTGSTDVALTAQGEDEARIGTMDRSDSIQSCIHQPASARKEDVRVGRAWQRGRNRA